MGTTGFPGKARRFRLAQIRCLKNTKFAGDILLQILRKTVYSTKWQMQMQGNHLINMSYKMNSKGIQGNWTGSSISGEGLL